MTLYTLVVNVCRTKTLRQEISHFSAEKYQLISRYGVNVLPHWKSESSGGFHKIWRNFLQNFV